MDSAGHVCRSGRLWPRNVSIQRNCFIAACRRCSSTVSLRPLLRFLLDLTPSSLPLTPCHACALARSQLRSSTALEPLVGRSAHCPPDTSRAPSRIMCDAHAARTAADREGCAVSSSARLRRRPRPSRLGRSARRRRCARRCSRRSDGSARAHHPIATRCRSSAAARGAGTPDLAAVR